jgi:hypothetical protein
MIKASQTNRLTKQSYTHSSDFSEDEIGVALLIIAGLLGHAVKVERHSMKNFHILNRHFTSGSFAPQERA